MRLLIWLVAAVLTLGAHGHAHARWLKAETQNFVIYSEGSEKSLRTFAENLQRFDATLRYRFKLSDAPDPNRLQIFLVERAEDAGRLATGSSRSSIAGFYSPAPDGSFAVSHRESHSIKGTPEAQQVLFHEYAHHFMHRYVRAAFPAWFVEGFAEYYSTVDFTKDQRAEIGKPVYGRAYGLLEMPKVPAKELLFKRPSEMQNSGQADVYYGRSWLLTHMLFNSEGRKGQLSAYITAINNGSESKQAATDSFGDLDLLDKDLNRYLTRPLNYVTTGQPMTLSGAVTITALSPAEDAVLPWRLERICSDNDEQLVKIRDALLKLSATYAGDAGLWFELAIANWNMSKETRDAGAARTAIDKALAIDPKHVRANVLLGQIIAAELDAKGDYSAGSWRKVRGPISLANRTNPDDPLPLYAFFQSFVDQGVNPPEIAIQGLARAFTLAPENITVRVSHAFALANKGEFDEAIKLGQTVAFNPHDNGAGQQLLGQLERMRDRAAGKDEDESADSEETAVPAS